MKRNESINQRYFLMMESNQKGENEKKNENVMEQYSEEKPVVGRKPTEERK